MTSSLSAGIQVGGDLSSWKKEKPIRSPFREPSNEEQRTACYLVYYIWEDNRPRPIPEFMAEVIESVLGLKKRKSKSSDREAWNWLPRLKFFENDFFLAATTS